MIDNLPKILNLNQLFLKPNWLIWNYTKYDIQCHSLSGVTHSYIIIIIIIDIIFYQVKMLLFYDVQTTNSTFVGKKWHVQ